MQEEAAAFDPGESYSRGTVLFLRRASGKGPRAAPKKPRDLSSQAPAIEPEEGDVLVARARTTTREWIDAALARCRRRR